MSPLAILVVAGDAGGANALWPVFATLRQAGIDLVLAGYATAPLLWQAKGEIVTELPANLDTERAARMLRECGAGLLMTGTSVNSWNMEQTFILAARLAGIPSLALLDFWSNYAPRFSSGLGRLDRLPDAIAVMDEQAQQEMVHEGFPPNLLHITGQPVFDGLARLRSSFDGPRREALRDLLGVRRGERLLVFVCQPLNDVYPEQGARAVLGYDEWVVLSAVADALGALKTEIPHVLVLLPHPREPKGKYESLVASAWARMLPDGVPSLEAALAADLVVGMNSMLLMESHLLGVQVVSVQPGLLNQDALPVSRNGAIPRVEKLEKLAGVLRAMLGVPTKEEEHNMVVRSSAGNVAALASTLLGQAF